MKAKLTYQNKLSWLRTHKVILKKEKIRASTVDRLYSFYQRYPLDTPRNLAYGLPKRIEKTLETKKEFQTPKGKITAKQYVRSIDKTTAKELREQIPPHIGRIKFSHRYKSGKRDDAFRYAFRDGKGITVNSVNIKSALAELERVHIPDLIETLNLFFEYRKYFYGKRLVGALILYDTENMPDDPIPRPVKFVDKNEFQKYLFDMLYELLVTDILRNYKDAIVRLRYIDVFIRTREKPTVVEQYL